MAVEDEPVGGKEACWGCPLWGCPNLTLPPLDILRLLSCKRIKESKSGVSGIETLGGTCCNNSFIRGTKLTGFPPTPPLLRLVEAGWRSWAPFFCELEAAATLAEEAIRMFRCFNLKKCSKNALPYLTKNVPYVSEKKCWKIL